MDSAPRYKHIMVLQHSDTIILGPYPEYLFLLYWRAYPEHCVFDLFGVHILNIVCVFGLVGGPYHEHFFFFFYFIGDPFPVHCFLLTVVGGPYPEHGICCVVTC